MASHGCGAPPQQLQASAYLHSFNSECRSAPWKLEFAGAEVGLAQHQSARNCSTMAEDLHRRLDDVFGALDQHDPHSSAPLWSITDRVVQNRGQEAPDSESEDEQEHRECIQVRQQR